MPRPHCFVLAGAVAVVTLAPPAAGAAQPRRLWATYVGGTHFDSARGIGVDAAGHVFVCADTESDDLGTPGTEAPEPYFNEDVVLFKFAPDGARLWATYVGAGAGDFCNGIAVDAAGNTVVVGYTRSKTGIATLGAPQTTMADYQDGMAIRYDADGKRVWGTYLGSSEKNDTAFAAAFDPEGNVYVGGIVKGPFPFALPPGPHDTTFNGQYDDGFMVKLSPSGALVWGTYYGGTSTDQINGLAVVGSDIIYASGFTGSSEDIATVGDTQIENFGGDAFVVRFDAAGKRVWGTYFGGNDAETLPIVAADANSVYLAGYTKSTLNLSTAGAHQIAPGLDFDGFLARLTPDGELDWATYYGGSKTDFLHGVAVDPLGDVVIVGSTWSQQAIAAPDALQPTLNGGLDQFVAKFDQAGQRQWGTYLGGNGGESYGAVAAVDAGTIYIVGETMSMLDLADHALFQPAFGGNRDAWLARLTEDLGTSCQKDADCDGGVCVDGVCCEAACGGGEAGDCQACSVAQGAPIDGVCSILGGATICRPAAYACDAEEVCTGDAAACPGDVALADDTPCDGGVCAAGECVPEMTTSTTDASTTSATDASSTGASTTDASSGGTTTTTTTGTGDTSTTAVTATTSSSTSDASGSTATPTTSGATAGESSTSSDQGTATATSGTGEPATATGSTTEPGQVDPGGCGCRQGESVPRDMSWMLLGLLALQRRRARKICP